MTTPEPPHRRPPPAPSPTRRTRPLRSTPAGPRRAGDGRAVRQVLAGGRRPGNVRAVAGLPRRRPAGRRSCCRSATSGSAPSWCCWPPAAWSLGVQRATAGRRSPWPAPALCALLAATRAPAGRGVDRRAVPAGRRRGLRGRTGERPHAAGVRAGRGRLAARRRCAGCRGWVARCARVTGLGTQRGRAARRSCCRCSAVRRLRAAVRLGRRALRRVGRRRRARTSSSTRFVLRGVRHRRRRRRRAGGDVPRAQPAARRARRAARSGRSRTATSGWRRCCSSTRSSWCSSAAQATVDLRRPRLPRAHHRADLRRVRPPGLRPAHRRHRAHPARRVGGGPQGAARRPPRTWPGCAARSACSAC